MTTPAEFASNFAGLEVPPALAGLLRFQEENGFETYSECFGLLADDKGGLRSWSSDDAFLSRLMPFAQATGGGPFYALWEHRPGASTSEMPVIVFGDEGGVHVIAEDVAIPSRWSPPPRRDTRPTSTPGSQPISTSDRPPVASAVAVTR